jgi:predicted transcriptional regulator of viral defense system
LASHERSRQLSSRWSGSANLGASIAVYRPQAELIGGRSDGKGVELTLLDCARYFHDAGGISGVAQIAKDIGGKANSRALADAANDYENSAVRRLGYLLDLANHSRQAKALEPFVKRAKTLLPLNPAVKPLVVSPAELREKNSRWKLVINESVEFDS